MNLSTCFESIYAPCKILCSDVQMEDSNVCRYILYAFSSHCLSLQDRCAGQCVSEKAFSCLNSQLYCQDKCQYQFAIRLMRESCPFPRLNVPLFPEPSDFFDDDPNTLVTPAVP